MSLLGLSIGLQAPWCCREVFFVVNGIPQDGGVVNCTDQTESGNTIRKGFPLANTDEYFYLKSAFSSSLLYIAGRCSLRPMEYPGQ